jgi:hypothetical protein
MTVLMLIIALPHSANVHSGYAHVHSDGHSVLRSATGAAATLSAHAGEVVAVVPHSRLAWLQVQLPPANAIIPVPIGQVVQLNQFPALPNVAVLPVVKELVCGVIVALLDEE